MQLHWPWKWSRKPNGTQLIRKHSVCDIRILPVLCMWSLASSNSLMCWLVMGLKEPQASKMSGTRWEAIMVYPPSHHRQRNLVESRGKSHQHVGRCTTGSNVKRWKKSAVKEKECGFRTLQRILCSKISIIYHKASLFAETWDAWTLKTNLSFAGSL